ncbi:MAG: hypothetical protein ABFC98_01340 [Candidatus Cloacimonas sp.]
MGTLLDVIGSVVTGGMLLVMLFTFTVQLQETTQRSLYTATMVDHMDQSAININNLFSLAGIGLPADSTCVVADSNKVTFRTCWDYNGNTITDSPHSIQLKLGTITHPILGTAIVISQDGTMLNNLGYILYIESLKFKYYNKLGQVTTTPSAVRSVDVYLTFRRDAPSLINRPLRTNIQLRCFFMNSYLRMGHSI